MLRLNASHELATMLKIEPAAGLAEMRNVNCLQYLSGRCRNADRRTENRNDGIMRDKNHWDRFSAVPSMYNFHSTLEY
jgi:hypothetical protein